MQRHHGALAEADECQRRRWKISPLELGIEKAFKDRSRLIHAGPAFTRDAKREWKPFAADRRLSARTRRMRRHECSAGQQALPGTSDVNQVIAVRTIAVQKDHQLASGA